MGKRIYILLTALLLSAVFIPKAGYAQKETIRLVFAETVTNSTQHLNTTVAKGNVEFMNGSNRLFCDSALFFRDLNLVYAYGNVQINQGDTVNLFCDSLKYNGKTSLSKLQGHVRFRDSEYLMLTDSMNYDGKRSIGYYTNHAKITSINSELKLTSVKGYYYSKSKTFYFKDSVHVEDPKYELFSDTLEFRTIASSAHFHGPTKIIFDSSSVDCRKGIYYSKEDRVKLWKGATINEPGRIFYSDSLLYNQKTDIGEGFYNVMMYDSTEKVKFFSDYMLKKPNNEEVILKKNARIYQFTEVDTLYLSGDTISYFLDTLTDLKLSILENNVEIIKGELFIRCDSAYFSEKDSILKLHQEPIIWNTTSQLTADSVLTTYYDNEFHKMTMYYNAMIVSEHPSDSVHYDQLKGKFMTATLDSSKISKVYIEQNAQTLYYPEETQKDSLGNETKNLSGMNRIDCNEIFIRFKSGEIQTISFLEQPTCIFYPIDQIPEKELFFKGFTWQINRKPIRPLPE